MNFCASIFETPPEESKSARVQPSGSAVTLLTVPSAIVVVFSCAIGFDIYLVKL